MHDGNITRHVTGWLGILMVIGMIAVSLVMNWRFGFSLGRTEFDGNVYGAASVCADVFKALVPFYFFAALRNRQWAPSIGAAVFWAVITAYSMTSAIGHSALNRTQTAGQRTVEATSYKDLRDDLKRNKDSLSWLPPHRGESTVLADILGKKAQKYWTDTNACTDADNKGARLFCQDYHKLNAELGAARDQVKYEAKIAEIETKLKPIATGAAAEGDADPQASAITRIANAVGFAWVKVPETQTALSLFVALLIELGSNLGLYLAVGHLQGGRRRVLDLKPYEEPAMASAAAPALAPATAASPLALPGSPPGSPAGAALLPQPAQATEPEQPEPENAALATVAGSAKEEPYTSDKRPVNPFLGRPVPGSESDLRSFGFPVDGRPPGGQRPKLAVKDEALQFCTALRAYGMANIAIPQTDMPRLYRWYAIANHREMVEEQALLEVMQRMRSAAVRVEYGKMRYDAAKPEHKRLSYKIAGKTYPKTQAAPQEVGGATVLRPPVGAAPDASPEPKKPRLAIVPTRSSQPDYERWTLQAEAAEARRIKAEQRGQMRQQRRTQHRWAA